MRLVIVLPLLLEPEIPRHLLIHDLCRAMQVDMMIIIREPLDVHLLRAHLAHDQGINQHGAMLEMNIIVSRPMLDEETTAGSIKTRGVNHGGAVVAGAVAGKSLHVALGVHAVVETPVGDGGGDHGAGEGIAI